MKFVLINGSARKGNTWKLAELVKETIVERNADATFEEIHLYQINMPFCCGCSNCFRVGHNRCPHISYLEPIIQAMEQADGIIFTSTTYNMRETALLKNLFDHLCFYIHRPHFFTSKALIVTTTGGVGGKAAAKSISSTLKAIGFNKCYLFSVASYSWNAYLPKQNTKEALHKITTRFIEDVESRKLHVPDWDLLIPYNLFRGMSQSYIKGSEFETEDGVFWTQEDRKKYVYDSNIKLPFYYVPIGKLFYLLGKLMGKRFMITYKK
jgi:multimeric flavodoxin WrbA